MNGNKAKDNRKGRLIIKLYGYIQKRYSSIARKLTNIIKPKPIKVSRFGRTFFVSGNLEYLLFWIYKFWERETYKIFNKFLDSNYSYIDIGAWIGSTVLYGAYLSKKVYAIEPDPIAFMELKKNVSLNPMLKEKIELHQKCINYKSGNVKFGNIGGGGDSTSSLLFPDSKTGWTVDGITFDEFIRENEINDCNFIKMDIEGGEVIVLPSMKIFLEKNKPILYLSMHPNIFKNPEEDTKKVIDVLKIYKNIYSDKGKKIELYDLLLQKKLKNRYSIVATDEEWN
jgi:FkbM family methyltransferase